MRKRYDDFALLNGSENEKLPKPSFLTVSQWIVGSWDSINEKQIKELMKQCGITLKTDGSEDKLLHCFNVKGNDEGFRILQHKRCEEVSCDLDVSDMSEDSVISYCDSDESDLRQL